MTLLQTSKEFVGGKWQKVGFYQKANGEVVVKTIR